MLIDKTRELLGKGARISTGKQLKPYLTSFRGKRGESLFAVEPETLCDLYRLIKLYSSLKVGYLIQGANTSLKGQSTPNSDSDPIVIIRTSRLKNMKILELPKVDQYDDQYKVLLVEPGLSLKEAEPLLNQIGFDLPHKIGSHEFGNTFGASSATGCGGVRVDNRDGRASTTTTGNMGHIAIGANGVIYNGFIKPERIHSGEELFQLIDANALTENDILFPHKDEIEEFIKKLFIPKSYPIRNHRGEILFAGDGGEGTQVIAYQMYLIRKKPVEHRTYIALFLDEKGKEEFYKEVFFREGRDKVDALPILCESMGENLVKEIVDRGTGFIVALFFAIMPFFFHRFTTSLFSIRSRLMKIIPFYIGVENFLGSLFSKFFSPKILKTRSFYEIVIFQVARRVNTKDQLIVFEKRLNAFVDKHQTTIKIQALKPHSLEERITLQIRNVAAVATLANAKKTKGVLLAFDDAMMPGEMVQTYCQLFTTRFSERFPGIALKPFIFGHDLKQINHNEWVVSAKLSSTEIIEIEKMQHQTVLDVGGIPHAEHGFGDCADFDFDREELVKLVSHRLLNDIDGLANPGGAYKKAYERAIQDETIVRDAIFFAKSLIQRELKQKTLLTWEGQVTKESNLWPHLEIFFKKVA